MRRAEFARACSGFADRPKEFSALVKHGDSPDEIGIRDVGMAFGNVDIPVARIRDDICRICQRFRRISSHTWFTKSQKHFALPINVNAVRPHEHSAAKASDLFARFIEMMDRIGGGPKATWRSPRRTS